MEKARSLIKPKPLEELFLQAIKKRNELIQAAEECARQKNEESRKRAIQAWAEEHLLIREKLNDEQTQALLPFIRKWHTKRLMKGIAGLGAWVLFQAAAIGALVGIPMYVSDSGYLTIFFLTADIAVALVSVIIDIFIVCDDCSFFRNLFESFVLHPARFLMHGHYRKLAKPEKIASLAVGD